VQQTDNTLGSNGQYLKVKQFLTPDYDYGDNEMSEFAQTSSGDYKDNTIGRKGQIQKVRDFLTPDGTNEMRGFISKRDTIGDSKIDESVYNFVNPIIAF